MQICSMAAENFDGNQKTQKKFEFYERKKQILDNQYEKSVSTIHTIKKYL